MLLVCFALDPRCANEFEFFDSGFGFENGGPVLPNEGTGARFVKFVFAMN